MEPWEKALAAFEEGRNILLTGGAGTGKSFNLRYLIEHFDKKDIECARTAMTGMASLQMPGGETVHSCFKTGIHSNKEFLYSIVTNHMFQKETSDRLRILKAIIIDEISMMRSDFLELLDAIMKYVMNNDRPFGGKQLILSGDFMQLPPVVKGGDEDEEIKNSYWAFESPVWESLNLKVIYLTEIKRQDNVQFATALNMIRAGAINDGVNAYFFKSHEHRFPEGVDPVRLLSTNQEVESSNWARLKALETQEEYYEANIWGKNEFLKKKMIQDVTAMEHLYLKKGCQVMILKNSKGLYVNGSMGEYLGTTQQMNKENKVVQVLAVRLYENNRTVYIERHEWTIEKSKNGVKDIQARFVQFPVKLGYAITIHKSQGMSIDFLEVNLSKCFADGMAYVALSRARTYEGLRVMNWKPSAVRCNQKAFNFYKNLKNTGVI